MDNCPSCSGTEGKIFYKIKNTPVHSTVLLHSRKKARGFPVGDVALKFCINCGLIYNNMFNNDLMNYSSASECRQGCSDVFTDFNTDLVKSFINDFDIEDKFVIEIGCGAGNFLTQLCIAGNNRGIGFDPAYNFNKPGSIHENVNFINDYYTDKYSKLNADDYFCIMTLEHIFNPKVLLTHIRASMSNANSRLFLQVPNMTQILDESRFWDIYYEHCNYFTKESLNNLLSLSGFKTEKTWTAFGGQYMLAIAKRSTDSIPVVHKNDHIKKINRFDKHCQANINDWKKKLERLYKLGHSIILWGSVSKVVSFIQATKSREFISYIVDINPRKQNKYLPGFGHKIVAPIRLKSILPKLIIVMNPIYENEIVQITHALGIETNITVLSN